MAEQSILSDYAELQAAMLERAIVNFKLRHSFWGIGPSCLPYLAFSVDAGSGTINGSPYVPLSAIPSAFPLLNKMLQDRKFYDASSKNRPLLTNEIRSLNNILEHLEGGNCDWSTYAMGASINNFWIDPSVEIEGARDIPWITGAPYCESIGGSSLSPYNWPADLAARGYQWSPVAPTYWLNKLGFQSRPMWKRNTPDNHEWFNYAKAFTRSLSKIAIRFNDAYAMQSYRHGNGYSQTSYSPPHDASYEEAVSNARADMESRSFSSAGGSILWSNNLASASSSHGRSSGDDYYDYGVTIYELKEIAFGMSNYLDLPVNVELYMKSGSLIYGGHPSRPEDVVSNGTTNYDWDGAFPPNPDGLFHKIEWASMRLEPSESMMKKKAVGATFIPPVAPLPELDPLVITGGKWNAVAYGTGDYLPGIGYFIITPEFKHLAG